MWIGTSPESCAGVGWTIWYNETTTSWAWAGSGSAMTWHPLYLFTHISCQVSYTSTKEKIQLLQSKPQSQTMEHKNTCWRILESCSLRVEVILKTASYKPASSRSVAILELSVISHDLLLTRRSNFPFFLSASRAQALPDRVSVKGNSASFQPYLSLSKLRI